jgi:M6 family metalloprotease-like protein
VSRRALQVIGGAATAALLTTVFQVPATGAPAADTADPAAVAKSDDRPDAAHEERRELNQRAVELVVSGEAKVENRGGSKAVRVAPGQWAQYGLQSSDNILTFLVEFGDQKDPRYTGLPAGPQHNEIPEPDRAVDNTTYWVEDFNRSHFLDMMFATEGESFKNLYEELSSGRYTVGGDVSEWVKVPYHEASYGQTESQTDMTRFVRDGATAWYESQKAAGKTDEQIKAYLADFDKWDRYDSDRDGNFTESDGYIDHFQQVHAGADESAGAPSWAIWAHRWSVGQSGRGTEGPSYNKFGGVQIGDTGFWIRDYTTEPENGGLGVFAHEYGHDLGLPDLYDTAGGENSTAFWTLMSSGSWMGHGQGTIGTTPNSMGAWEKLQLGWLDYEVAQAGVESTHVLGPAYHATKQAQALVDELPDDAAGNARFYIAENRQYLGYDSTLRTGPYNWAWPISQPDRAEHFPYQDGLLISYWNTAQRNNQTARHPGEGLVLPVDARPAALRWSDGVIVRNRIQPFDATFGVEATDPISLHREIAGANGPVVTTLDVPSQAAVPVFDDTNPLAYYDAANPQGSVKVAGTGTQIRVAQSNNQSMMTVQVY